VSLTGLIGEKWAQRACNGANEHFLRIVSSLPITALAELFSLTGCASANDCCVQHSTRLTNNKNLQRKSFGTLRCERPRESVLQRRTRLSDALGQKFCFSSVTYNNDRRIHPRSKSGR
jgi:bacterioferritin-associated ferredoxin